MTRMGPVLLTVLLYASPGLLAQGGVETALRFFAAGGAYCFRVAPEGVALNEETGWTFMLLTGGANRQRSFRVRTVDPGTSGVRTPELDAVGMAVAGVWRMDSSRTEFFERFADAIARGAVRARVVTHAPRHLAAMSARQRADAYLSFADKGEKVDFSKAPNLTADQFMMYATHVPD